MKLLILLLQYDITYQVISQLLPHRYLIKILQCEGIVEVCGSGKIIGWARSRSVPHRHLEIDLYDGLRLLATVKAEEPRPDLKRIIPHADCFGFTYPLPLTTDSTTPLLIRATFKGTDIELKYRGPKWVHPGEDITLTTPWVESPFFCSALSQKDLSEDQVQQVEHYHTQGFLVIENAIPNELIDRVLQETMPLFDPNGPQGPPSFYRIQDAWKDSEAVRLIASQDSIYSLLNLLYGREPRPFQTLNFRYGTQQRGHSDSIHFSCLPARFLAGVWVALEDITEGNGPVFYYPGSHRLPEYTYYDLQIPGVGSHKNYEDCIEALMESQHLEKRLLTVKKGTALIWSSNIIHGGSPISKEGETRFSQVTHYFFDSCIYYSPLDSNPLIGEYHLLTLTDIKTGQPLRHTFNGAPVDCEPVGNDRFRIRF